MGTLSSDASKELCFAGDILRRQAQVLRLVAASLGADLVRFVDCLEQAKGKIAVVGMGGSRHLARWLAGRFSSTGTPACYFSLEELADGDFCSLSGDDALVTFLDARTEEKLDLLFRAAERSTRLCPIVWGKHAEIEKRASALLALQGPGDVSTVQSALSVPTSADLFLTVGDMLALTLMRRRAGVQGSGKVEVEKRKRGRPKGSKTKDRKGKQ